ncbi:MAG: sigma 54-interacting transcriptional regulator [Myxococcales bacterium]|nr:sigma 54-interacting transcriptional regulator [Myxococcales bacterium]
MDLVPAYELKIGSDADAEIRVDVSDVAPHHASLTWDGAGLTLSDTVAGAPVEVNGEAVTGANALFPGDEVKIGPATLVVNVALAPTRRGRRSLTHGEFVERVAEELARASRSGRTTCLVMLKSRSGDGSKLAGAALESFREGDIVGTYAHDEIEFLLPDTPPNVARAVVERLIETSESENAAAGLAAAPEDGDGTERLMRAARDALAVAIGQGGGIARSGGIHFETAVTPDIHTTATQTVVDAITRAADSEEPLLLVGEPSSGKRHYAQLFHEKSARCDGPLVVIQCAGLLDSESIAKAFGRENGSADGERNPCTADTAKEGTLILEEIGDLPTHGQRRLLQLLDRGAPDYNIVATTHRDLAAMAEVHVFQQALLDKLAAREIQVPALRMRAESIVPLAQNFAKEFDSDRPIKLSAGAIDRMRSYSWPGNVLELRNAMERAVALADGGEILAEHLPGDLAGDPDGRLREHVGSVERDAIQKALADNNYNQTHAAKILGISRRALIYKMEKYGLKPPPAGKKG